MTLNDALDILQLRGCKVRYVGKREALRCYSVTYGAATGYFGLEALFELAEMPRQEMPQVIANAQIETKVSGYLKGATCP